MKKNVLFMMLMMATFLVVSCKNKSEGEAAAVSDAGQAAQAEGVAYKIDPATTVIMWEGSKVAGKHNGTVNVSEGEVFMKDGTISGGNFTIDMTTIVDLDLEGEYKTSLEDHLKGTASGKEDDFFNVVKYPTAKFEITKVSALENDAEGTHLIYGNLTLKDITKEVGFKASVSNIDGKLVVVTPQFTINRTDWGIKYGSASFFDNLADKAIDDNFGLKISLNATTNEVM
ncbi:MAG: YceI family protein [Saprospiraceae bacterium]|nr:YceI family protein [Saprospiraceae bacterium]HMS67322.1 YceI family protein [Saprospiraceae bacterium]